MHPNDIKRVFVFSLIVTALLGLRPAVSHAGEFHIVCPAQVDANQIVVTSPAGWKGLFRPGSKTMLTGAGVWVGPLNAGAPGELIGETIKGRNGTTINRFPALDTPPLIDGVPATQDTWMVCTYDSGIVQVMKLPNGVKQCDVTYKRMPDPLEPGRKLISVVSDITCK